MDPDSMRRDHSYDNAERATEILRFFVLSPNDHRDLHSFPTRRSSDLACDLGERVGGVLLDARHLRHRKARRIRDRKSTRLNSSHITISYAVFCLKKKKITKRQ